jgi:hypothetical protein
MSALGTGVAAAAPAALAVALDEADAVAAFAAALEEVDVAAALAALALATLAVPALLTAPVAPPPHAARRPNAAPVPTVPRRNRRVMG